jgi:hypothetical protein
MVKVSQGLPAGAKLRACVHDELILSAPAEIAEQTLKLVHQSMTEAFTELLPNIPIEVQSKICRHWGEKMTDEIVAAIVHDHTRGPGVRTLARRFSDLARH